jgi:hypothetical protein
MPRPAIVHRQHGKTIGVGEWRCGNSNQIRFFKEPTEGQGDDLDRDSRFAIDTL